MPDTNVDGEVVYRIRADTSQYKKDLKESEQEAKKSAKKTADILSDGMEKAEDAAQSAAKEITAAMSDTAKSAEDTAEAVDALGDAAKDAEEPLRGIGDETEKAKNEYKDFSGELEEISRLLEKDSKNTVLSAQKKKLLSDSIVETSKKLSDLKEQQRAVEKAFKSGDMPDEEYRKFQREIAATVQELEGYRKELAKTGDTAKETAEKIKTGLGDAGKAAGSIAASAAAAAGTAVLGVATATVGVGALAVNTANDMDKAMNSFAASTGTSGAALEQYQDVLEEIYKDNYGEDFQDIADSMAIVRKNLGDLNSADMQNVTEAAFMLRDTFEYDIAESTRAAKAMMDNFGISGETAMGLIAAGAQNGLDYSGELIDSISEYSVQFAKLGFTADDMFRIMEKGAESGAWNLDKVGDAIKELSIRVIDGSDSTAAGFESIGLNADRMAMKFALGGESAKEAFAETVAALDSLGNPLAKDAAGVALFGTMWEDLGADVVASLADIDNAAYNTGDALSQIGEVKYDDLGSMFEALKRSAEMLLLPLGEQLIPTLGLLIDETLPLLEEALPPLVDAFTGMLPPILELASEVLPGLMDGFAELVQEDLLPYLTDVLLPDLKEMGESLRPVLEEFGEKVLPLLYDLFGKLMDEILELASAILPPLIEVFTALLPPVLDLIDFLLPVLVDLLMNLVPIIEDLIPVIQFLAEVFGVALQGAIIAVEPFIKGLMNLIELIAEVFKNVVAFINNVLAGDWKSAWENIKNIFSGILNLFPEMTQTVFDTIVGIINGMLNGINALAGKVGLELDLKVPQLPRLPRYHTGGIIDFDTDEAPILAQDGEMVLTKAQQQRLFAIADGENLAVSNELDRMLRLMASTLPQTEHPQAEIPEENGPYIFYLVVDGETVADAALPHIDRKQGETIILNQRWH